MSRAPRVSSAELDGFALVDNSIRRTTHRIALTSHPLAAVLWDERFFLHLVVVDKVIRSPQAADTINKRLASALFSSTTKPHIVETYTPNDDDMDSQGSEFEINSVDLDTNGKIDLAWQLLDTLLIQPLGNINLKKFLDKTAVKRYKSEFPANSLMRNLQVLHTLPAITTLSGSIVAVPHMGYRNQRLMQQLVPRGCTLLLQVNPHKTFEELDA